MLPSDKARDQISKPFSANYHKYESMLTKYVEGSPICLESVGRIGGVWSGRGMGAQELREGR